MSIELIRSETQIHSVKFFRNERETLLSFFAHPHLNKGIGNFDNPNRCSENWGTYPFKLKDETDSHHTWGLFLITLAWRNVLPLYMLQKLLLFFVGGKQKHNFQIGALEGTQGMKFGQLHKNDLSANCIRKLVHG